MLETLPGDPFSGSSIVKATHWVQALLLGAVGTSIAVIAMAGIGLAMLQGRIPVRRGVLIVIGCFTIFSARTIAEALRDAASDPLSNERILPVAPPLYVASMPPPVAYDPYAGASVPIRPQDSNQTVLPH